MAKKYSSSPAPLAYPTFKSKGELGVHLRGDGVDVAVFAARATRVDFCLLQHDGNEVSETLWTLRRPQNGIWRGHIPGVKAGQTYGFRVYGPWDPTDGQLHNPAKLLLDPYARGLQGELKIVPAVFGHQVDENLKPIPGKLTPNPLDSAPFVPWAVVIDDDFPELYPAPRIDPGAAIIYETHVRGLTMTLPGVPEEIRGTYAGLAHPVTIAHLKKIGVTTIELLPIHACAPEPFIEIKNLINYWGYNTLSYFTPEPRYATAQAQAKGAAAILAEVKGMVSILHQNGFEVILDVVYNHTCEGGSDGPTLSWRGLDNVGYYLNHPGTPDKIYDTTGCGNTLDFRHRVVMQITLDSLRYWVEKVGVDGFRFDLATTLGRNREIFTPYHPALTLISLDPVLRHKRLIAEPWDVGPNGWQTGNFPASFADWNDKFRDTVRSFWITDMAKIKSGKNGADMRDFATRLAGSADLFAGGDLPGGRGPNASINFVTAHDGFTCHDLVAYNEKHNQANLEDNRDGSNNNLSWNHGVEGSTNDPVILRERQKSILNLLGTTLLAAGTPMLTAGDEIGRTQQGNNNAYCQDNEISWINWNLASWQTEIFDSISQLIHLRRQHPVLRIRFFASGTPMPDDELADMAWFDINAQLMQAHKWHDNQERCLQMRRSGKPFQDVDSLVMINASAVNRNFTLPANHGSLWQLHWNSAAYYANPISSPQTVQSNPQPNYEAHAELLKPGKIVSVPPFSLRLYLSEL